MTIAFDHRPLRPLEAALMSVRGARLAVTGSRAIVALLGALALTAAAGGILAMRLHASRADVGADLVRLNQPAAAAAPAKLTLQRIGEIRALADDVTQARQSGDRAADELAQLGNAVPSHVWIARFRRDGGALIVDGGAGSVDAVGRALASLDGDHAHAQLVGLKDAARPGAPSDIRYSLRIDQR
jgi:Tfp pilus assembly protein PilN